MSALAGLWRFDDTPDVARDCARMLAAQEIYGPDDGRQWAEGSLALGRQLYRTLPEDRHDRQPLHGRDGRLTLVADVRLDNRAELARALDLPDSEVASLCDAAVLLLCLEKWGEGALDRLVGEFAFALWNAQQRTLMLARDFRGSRPLQYHCGADFFAFASMPKGLHALPDVPYAPNERLVAEFLALLPRSGSDTYFEGIERVEPGHVVTVTRDGLTCRRYWEPQRPARGRRATSDYVEGLRFHLDQATEARLRGGEGSIGAALSGGFDSGAVAATAARLLAPRGGSVIAFTGVPRAGYDGPDPKGRFGDEGPLAGATAALYPNMEHVLIRRDDRTPLDALDRNFFLYGAPLLNLCNGAWSTSMLNAVRDRKLKILLEGQMGNMTISYAGSELLPELLRAGRLSALWRAARLEVAAGRVTARGAVKKALAPWLPNAVWRRLGGAADVGRYSAISAARLAELNLEAAARERGQDLTYPPWGDGFAMRLWFLRRADGGQGQKGMLAGWGVDWRDPTGDKRLVEYCLGIPTEEYRKNGIPRALGRTALADRLPRSVLDERRRGYQSVDWHEGVTAARGQIADELARLETDAGAARALDLARMKRLVDTWPTEGWERSDVTQDYRLALLRGISAGHFLRKASGSN